MHLPFQYATTRNFFAVSPYTTQDFVVIGAPVDCATSFRSGSRIAPNAIRDASMMLTDGVHPRYPVDLTQWIGDAGDMVLPSGNTEAILDKIESYITGFTKEHVITLGGDHSITLGILRAHARVHSDIAVVHFDAHCDTWQSHFGEPHGHGTWMYNAVEEKLINANHSISIGVRSPADTDTREYLSKKGGTTISARQASNYNPLVMADIIKAKVAGRPAYLTLDIDCLDPAYAPGTGTPEIGGLSTMWMLELLENLQGINWIGMDCVEVNPAYDHGQITALAAATFVWQYLSMIVTKS